MPKRIQTPSASNPRQHWALAVLCLLRERPMHPYEMRKLMSLRHKSDRLELKPGSLYNAVTWLTRQGLIRVAATTRAGRRPNRTIYRITPAGDTAVRSWLTQMLGEPRQNTSSFVVALDHLVHMSPADAAEVLARRRAALARIIADLQAQIATLAPKIGRINLIEVEHDLALARAEHDWLERILHELRCGTLQWNTEEILAAVRGTAGTASTSIPATQ